MIYVTNFFDKKKLNLFKNNSNRYPIKVVINLKLTCLAMFIVILAPK